MWVFCRAGFFSAVAKDSPDRRHKDGLCIRSRCRADLELLKELYFSDMGPIYEGGGTDYPYRTYCSIEEWALVCDAIAADIDYGNFKDAIYQERGPEVAHLYGSVWSAMYGAEQKIARDKPRKRA